MTPLQLPPAIADFTGRAAHLRRLDELMAEREDAPKALVITSIAGTAGVGKTALAVHWAHRVRHQFPDGQLYVNLLGHAQSPPLHPEQALGQFLRALGVPAELVPAGVAEASGMYRSLVADKRMLVVLDNAASPDQVRPLLPASAGCLVVVTSRDRLDGLVAKDAARRITVEVMPLDEALALLGRMMGENRIGAEPGAAAELATTCACLPLALRIAAAQLASQPDRAIADYVAELGQGNPLVCLEIDGDDNAAAVRAAFDLSYAALKPDAQRLFRHLGLLSGPDTTVAATTELTARTRTQTAQLLDHLAAAHLVYQHAPGRYTFHDLLRRYAQARAAGDVDGGKERARGPLGRGDLQGSGPVGAFEDEHGNLTSGPALILGVGRESGDRAVPPLGALVTRDLPGGHVPPVRAILDFDPRVRAEVVVPARMGRRAALRRHRHIAAVMLDPHHRCLAHLAAARPTVGDDHHGKTGLAQGRALRPTRALKKLDLLADPALRARLIFTLDRHAPSQHLRSGPPHAGPPHGSRTLNLPRARAAMCGVRSAAARSPTG